MKFKNISRISLIICMTMICIVIAVSGCVTSDSDFTDFNYSNQDSNTANQTMENGSTLQNSSNNALKTSEHYEASGYCPYVVDGDTLDVEGVGRIRFVGVNTPERGEPGYQEAKDYVKRMCLGKTVYLDIDDEKHHDKYGRVLAVVYAGNVNINQELLKRGYAEVMYIPPSEFNPYSWT
ncbi:Thermonuclease [Methanobacterium congolense]|uniref:Thermonuclease n=2 Tax=Methanobacterium congolense TaxID=118062 RepID=A0A1D3L0V8_9EURY|nr:Thermonuclease [Methanobacterium congolense]